MSSIAVLALKLGVHVLNTLWKVCPCGKWEAPTPVGHVQRHISPQEASSWKFLQVTKVFPVPLPACMSTSFFLDVLSILVKILNWPSFNQSCWSKWESWSHWQLMNLSLQQSNMGLNFDHCSLVRRYSWFWQIRYSNCSTEKAVSTISNNSWYASHVHETRVVPEWSSIRPSSGPWSPEVNTIFSLIGFPNLQGATCEWLFSCLLVMKYFLRVWHCPKYCAAW